MTIKNKNNTNKQCIKTHKKHENLHFTSKKAKLFENEKAPLLLFVSMSISQFQVPVRFLREYL